ncbi:MAG: TetR/AcrR family transcriptional regulator [Athalassotoga sp.]|uniref:TetR/AcrR family transcriptional regulator n=1 Tax=Athalassotoga sp. TaxID=2022597 RepID=UPI003D0938F6
MPRVPTSEKGINTYNRIIEKSVELFRTNGYQEVSAAMISKRCDIGNASFYQYFDSKEEILIQIVHDLTEWLKKNIHDIIANTRSSSDEERFRIFIKAFVESISEKINEYSVFRNAEFLFPHISMEFYDSLYNFMSEEFLEILDSTSKRAFYLFMMGIVNFVVIEYAMSSEKKIDEKVIDAVFDLIYNGIDPDNHLINQDAFEMLPELGEDQFEFKSQWSVTHKKILTATEQLFGSKGYSKTKISDISNLAGVGLGTFYVHFDSKIEALRELVSSTLEALKRSLRRYVWRFTDRRDAEISGYMGFLDFFKHHKEMYSIIREMEFVDSKTSIYYYAQISKSYIKPLDRAFKNNEYRPFEPVLLSYMLMGIGHQIGLESIIEKDMDIDELKRYVKEISKFLMHGLRGEIR